MIFISDLPDAVMAGNTIALYADDCKTSRMINCPSDYPVSSVGTAPDCRAGGRRFKPRPDQHSGSLNN